MMTRFYALLFVAGLAASCNNSAGYSEQPVTNARPPAVPQQTLPPAMTAAPDLQKTAATPPAATGDVKLNPAHGLPGHDCNIPVGQPLKGSPATATTQTAAPVQTAVPVKSPKPAGRLNPAHGQPGHDCNVPVGQPLK